MEKKLVYYRDNPDLGYETVTTVTGETEYRRRCKKIKQQYYAIGRDCHFVNGLWYRVSSGLIFYDHETKEWFLLKDRLKRVKGIVGSDENGLIFGYFSRNHYKNCLVTLKGHVDEMNIGISSEVLNEAGFAEELSTGIWKDPKSPRFIRGIKNIIDNTGQSYNIEDNLDEFEMKVIAYENFKPHISKDVKSYGKMLGDTSFGFEFESARGYLPPHLQCQHGVVICRDGSLNDENGKPGPEYVTVPMRGAKGLQTIMNLTADLSIRNEIDLKCSMHVHLGNLPTTRLYLLSIYRLGLKLQEELFKMFPYYKTDPRGAKPNHPNGAENYCQKLPQLGMYSLPKGINKEEFKEWVNAGYKRLFTWLSGGAYPDNKWNRKRGRHPQPHKWNRPSRYYWLNLMNTIFSPRNTVEFRLHTPTLNAQKTINWLFICNAIVRYAETHASKIFSKDPIKLSEVLTYYHKFGCRGRSLSEYLSAYVEFRKKQFAKDYISGDRVSHSEIDKDAEFEFKHGNIKYLM